MPDSRAVAHENLGVRMGLLAAAALMADYVLNVAVGISAGVGAIISAAPELQPHTFAMCLAILALIVFVNLRGQREPGLVFMLPTVLFFSPQTKLGACFKWIAPPSRQHHFPHLVRIQYSSQTLRRLRSFQLVPGESFQLFAAGSISAISS